MESYLEANIRANDDSGSPPLVIRTKSIPWSPNRADSYSNLWTIVIYLQLGVASTPTAEEHSFLPATIGTDMHRPPDTCLFQLFNRRRQTTVSLIVQQDVGHSGRVVVRNPAPG